MKKLFGKNQKALTEGSAAEKDSQSPWWVIVAKVVAYAIGLILAGYGTAEAATQVMSGLNI